MTGTPAVLRELHRLRKHARNLKDEIDKLPRLLKAQQAKVAKQEELLKQTQDKILKLKLAGRDKEKTLKSTHEQIAKYTKQLDSIANKKEMDALQVEIKHGREAGQKLEDETLAVMEETDALQARLPDLEKALKDAQADLANFDQIKKEKQANLTGELDKTLKELKEVELSLPEETREQYGRQVSSRGEDALSAVADRNCTACYTGITAQMYNNLVQGQFVLCKNCGRILYLAE